LNDELTLLFELRQAKRIWL